MDPLKELIKKDGTKNKIAVDFPKNNLAIGAEISAPKKPVPKTSPITAKLSFALF